MGHSPVKSVILLVTFVLLLLFSGDLLSLYVDALWFKEVQYYPVFLKTLLTKLALGLIHGLAFFILLYPNLSLAQRYRPAVRVAQEELDPLGPFLKPIILGGSFLLSLIIGFQGSTRWSAYLLFSHAVSFGMEDPLFKKDLAFYVFQFPFLTYVQGWLSSTLMMILLLCTVLYFYRQGVRMDPQGIFVDRAPRRHLVILGGIYLFLLSWSYYLDLYRLLYSTRGVVFGAVYADVNARLPMLWVLLVLSLVAGALLIIAGFRRGWFLPGLAVGSLIIVHIVGGSIVPDMLHRFQVAPNEIMMERPFIQHNIQATRFAYNLHRIDSQEFPASDDLTPADLAKNELTTKNVRLWEHRPLLATYQQLQQIRTYYNFVDVDNDRYVIDGEYRQIMLSPRELSYKNLPSRIWINEHLTYTHGYGVTLGPVSRISKEGLPEFFIKDIPPIATTNIAVQRPEIYYGEIPNDYVFVKTKALEFDYPSGAENVYTNYQGKGGVPASSFLRKLAFATYFGSLKIILSNDITAESRIMYSRHIAQRVRKVTPFIVYDEDPYMVITQEGRLVWILDGYTTTDKIPYSQPLERLGNYIRNSVKATVDAYDGTLNFYIGDPEDPIIRAYSTIFPGLFQPLDQMQADLRDHLRYPQDFFKVQAHMYSTYHMEDPQIFYNKEDLWNIPQKDNRDMEPYYTIMKLPGEKKEEFILLIPFTPSKRDNLSAWMTARTDAPHYGKLIVYVFPKQKLIFGPRQVENRINQDAYISQQLTLWSQQGSQVIRGNVLVIPVENSLLYVSPLYLASSAAGSLPELRRVITAYGNRLVMEENLEAALNSLFGRQPLMSQRQAGEVRPPAQSIQQLVSLAQDLYRQSQNLLKEGRWSEYGEAIKKFEETLRELANRIKKE
jgi:uncharacterized membrane protein (UPF0182 family)